MIEFLKPAFGASEGGSLSQTPAARGPCENQDQGLGFGDGAMVHFSQCRRCFLYVDDVDAWYQELWRRALPR